MKKLAHRILKKLGFFYAKPLIVIYAPCTEHFVDLQRDLDRVREKNSEYNFLHVMDPNRKEFDVKGLMVNKFEEKDVSVFQEEVNQLVLKRLEEDGQE